MISLEVIYESYPDARLHRAVVEGPTAREALVNAHDTSHLFLNSEEAKDLTISEMVDVIDYHNGDDDGCDFVYSIKNLNTGDTYYIKSDYILSAEEHQ